MTTNDPQHPMVKLTCKGEIRDAYKLSPNSANFGPVSRKSPPRSKKVVLTSADGGPLNPKLKVTELDNIKAELTEISPGERYEITVSLNPPLKTERFRSTLTLETGIAAAPTATIPIIASTAARVTTIPRRFVVPVEREPDWEQRLRVAWDDDVPHRILGAEVNDPALTVKVLEEDGTQEVVLQAPLDQKARIASPTVTIKTDDDAMPELQVRVTVAGKSPRTHGVRATSSSDAAQAAEIKKARLRQKQQKQRSTKMIEP